MAGHSDSSTNWVIPSPVHQYDGQINDLQAFTEARDARSRLPNVGAYLDEKKNPRIILDLRERVTEMYNAFLQTDHVKDPLTTAGHPAQAVDWMMKGHWSHDLIWKTCWKLVIDCIDVQCGGSVGAIVKDTTKETEGPSVFVQEYSTIEARFMDVHYELWSRKSTCKNWLDAEYNNWQQRIVAAPLEVSKNKEIQGKNNNKRRQPASRDDDIVQPAHKIPRTALSNPVSRSINPANSSSRMESASGSGIDSISIPNHQNIKRIPEPIPNIEKSIYMSRTSSDTSRTKETQSIQPSTRNLNKALDSPASSQSRSTLFASDSGNQNMDQSMNKSIQRHNRPTALNQQPARNVMQPIPTTQSRDQRLLHRPTNNIDTQTFENVDQDTHSFSEVGLNDSLSVIEALYDRIIGMFYANPVPMYQILFEEAHRSRQILQDEITRRRNLAATAVASREHMSQNSNFNDDSNSLASTREGDVLGMRNHLNKLNTPTLPQQDTEVQNAASIPSINEVDLPEQNCADVPEDLDINSSDHLSKDSANEVLH